MSGSKARADAFLGRGWSFPPRFGPGGGEVALVSGEQDIHQSLEIILGTRLGERSMHAHFGCKLDELVFAEIDRRLINQVAAAVSDAILYHEPRVRLRGVEVFESRDRPGLLEIEIDYEVVATNSRYNMVYPFYLNEAVPGAR